MTQSIEKLAIEIADKARKTYVGGDAWPPLLEHAIRLALKAGEQRGINLGRKQGAQIADGFAKEWNEKRSLYDVVRIDEAEGIAQAIRNLP